ncbi:MAG: choice-of-anchor D domain-containing protein [Myxococcota bacterium]
MSSLGRLFAAPLFLTIAACDCGGGEPGIRAIHGKLEVSTEALDFGNVAVNNSKQLDLVLRNTGEARLSVRQLTVEGDPFSLSVPDLITLNSNDEKTISIQFAPTAVGRFDGAITIETDASTDNTNVSLTGVGVQPGVEVTPSGNRCGSTARSISFDGTPVGSAGLQSVTLKSIGSSTTTILGARVESSSGEFSVVSPPAGTALPPGSTFQVQVQYQPTDVGMDDATLVILTDAIGESEIRVALCGFGTKAALCGNPVPIDVGRVDLGSSAQVPFELKNCGNQAVEVSALAISSDAAHPSAPGLEVMGPSVPHTLMPNDSISLTVRYTPPALGPITGFLAVRSNAGDEFFPILARGVEPCDLTALPATLSFGTVAAGASADRALEMANQAATTCTITRIEVTMLAGTFSVVSPPTLPLGVPAGGSQSLTVRYAPASAQMSSGMLEVEAGRSVRQIPLIGNAPPTPGCHLEATPSPLAFGVVGVNQSATRMLTIHNTSMNDCHLTDVQLDPGSSPGFMDPAQGAATIAAGAQLTVNVTYHPTVAAAGHGTLHILSDDTTNPTLDVPLTATAQGPGICVMPTRLSFGNVQGSRDLTFQIVACGSSAVDVTGLPFSQPDPQFTLVSPPATPFNLAQGASRTITVRYTPTTMNGAMGAVDVRSNDAVSPSITVHLEGGAQIVPPAAGRYLYYWRVGAGLFGSGDVMRLPLQGTPTPQPYWGVSTGKPCSGCHALSPDGRYLALVNSTTNFGVDVVDTTTNQRVPLGFTVQNALLISWRPNVNSVPPYQFAFDDGDQIQIASVTGGLIGPLRGADTAGFKHKMPSWGPNGKVAFVRGTREATPFGVPAILGLGGSCDVMTVDEMGGTPTALAGASGNGHLNYYPAYSPNGLWIAFTTSSGASTYAAADASVHLVAADGSGRAPNLGALNGVMGASSFPTWSHDGAYLSFSSNRPGGLGDWDIWFAPIDQVTGIPGPATNLREANTAGFDHVARWSP